eukprot:403362200
MEGNSGSNQINSGILLMMFEFEPDVGFLLKLSMLNKKHNLYFKNQFEGGLIKRLQHKDHGVVSKNFVRRVCKYLGKGLEKLDFEFSAVNDQHIEITKFPESLKELNLNGCREISEKTCVHLTKYCKNLIRIELYWNCRVIDFGIKKLSSSNPNLSYVNLSGCKYLTDSSIIALCENCPEIYHLNITRIPKITKKSMESIASLKNLEYLNLYANSEISDNGFQILAQSQFHKLTFLDFCGCKYLSDDSVIALCKNYPDLTYLNLTWCVSLTDKGIVDGITAYLSKLNLLSLYGLVTLTDKAIDAILNTNMKYTLEIFDINGCREITKSDEATLKSLFPNVKVLVYHS